MKSDTRRIIPIRWNEGQTWVQLDGGPVKQHVTVLAWMGYAFLFEMACLVAYVAWRMM